MRVSLLGIPNDDPTLRVSLPELPVDCAEPNSLTPEQLGTGERGIVDGAAPRARLSFPNGVACDPWTSRLYINEALNGSESALPRRTIVRVVELESRSP